MALTFADRVQDTTTSEGTGNLTLSGTAPTGYVNFNTGIGVGPTFDVLIVGGTGEWEKCRTVLSAATTLVRGGSQTVLASSNAGAAVNFSAGTKNVVHGPSASWLAGLISDTAYDATTWNGVVDVAPSKNAVRDEFETKADGTPGVKIYRASVTQSGTDAPTATVLENSIGAVVWSRVAAGQYDLTLNGAFPTAKVWSSLQDLHWDGGIGNYFLSAGNNNAMRLTIVAGDGFLGTGTEAFIEVYVYP